MLRSRFDFVFVERIDTLDSFTCFTGNVRNGYHILRSLSRKKYLRKMKQEKKTRISDLLLFLDFDLDVLLFHRDGRLT